MMFLSLSLLFLFLETVHIDLCTFGRGCCVYTRLYVKPTDPPNSNCPGQPCQMLVLVYYFRNEVEYLSSDKVNVTMLLLHITLSSTNLLAILECHSSSMSTWIYILRRLQAVIVIHYYIRWELGIHMQFRKGYLSWSGLLYMWLNQLNENFFLS